MATTFATSLQALVAERDAAFVSRLASELSLDVAELTAKYAEVTAAAFKLPKKMRGPREAKPGSQPCKGTTAKGVPCKFSALPGKECCKRHSREPSEAKEAKPPKEKKEKPVKAAPKHTHDLDGEEHPECPLCESHSFGPFKLPPVPEADESDSEDLVEDLKRQLAERQMHSVESDEESDGEEARVPYQCEDSDEDEMVARTAESDGESEFDEE